MIYDLHVQRNTLLLAGVFESSRNTCLEIYELDPTYFHTVESGIRVEHAVLIIDI